MGTLRVCSSFLFVFLLGFSHLGLSQATLDTLVVRDLSLGWKSMDGDGRIVDYIPEKSRIVTFVVPPGREDEIFTIFSNSPLDIWFGDQLVFPSFTGKYVAPLDSLQALDSAFSVTVYGRHGIDKNALSTYVETVKPLLVSSLELSRSTSAYVTNLSIMLTVLVILLGIYKHYFPMGFRYTFKSPVSIRLKGISSEENYTGFFGQDNLYGILYLSFATSFILFYLKKNPLLDFTRFTQIEGVWLWLSVSLLIITWLVAKYLFSWLTALIFDWKPIPDIQNQDYVRFLSMIAMLSMAILLLDFTLFGSGSILLFHTAQYLWVGGFIFIVFWQYLKLDTYYSHRKIMIIAYLCTTEMLPAFLVIYWLIRV